MNMYRPLRVSVSLNVFLATILLGTAYSTGAQQTNTHPFANGLAEIIGLDAGMLDESDLPSDMPIAALSAAVHEILIKRGYIFSKVIIAGRAKIIVLPGRVNRIEFKGLSPKAEAQARRYIKHLIGVPIRIEPLERALSLIGDLAGVEATISLRRLDEHKDNGVLTINARERRQSGGITVDAIPRSGFSRGRIAISQKVNSIFIGGDMMRLNVTHLRGDDKPTQTNLDLAYRAPVTDSGAYFELNTSDLRSATNLYTANNAVQRNDFDGRHYSLTFGYPQIRLHDHSRYWIVNAEKANTQTSGQSQNTTNSLRFIVFDSHSDSNGDSNHLGVTFSLGQADNQNILQDGSFWHLRVGYGKILAIDAVAENAEVRIEGFGQYSNDVLPGNEIFFLGGEDFLRGYAPSSYTGSRGGAGTIEVAQVHYFSGSFLPKVTPYLFYDFGYVDNKSNDILSPSHPDNKFIQSIGLGAEAFLKNSIYINAWAGLPLNNNAQGESLSPAIYANFSIGW